MTEEIVYHEKSDIATIRINRPAAMNAMNWAAMEGFASAVTAVSQSPNIRALIITGTGRRAFVGGGDLKELSQNPDKAAGERLNQVMGQALEQLTTLPIPVIAAINGDAFGGGCEMITACDLRLAAAHARFSFAQVKVGLTTGWGGTVRLVHLIGQSRALELLLTARLFDAETALQLGLIHRILPTGEALLGGAQNWACKLASLPRKALAATKALVYTGAHLSLAEGYRAEKESFLALWSQPDHIEAMAAFVEKRNPKFG